MKINEDTAILTPNILLVPYSKHHVPHYHRWMTDADLQKATASEPLSLAEEYAMQKSWREDGDKLTFIVCLPPAAAADGGGGDDGMLGMGVRGGREDADERMVGDVNLFLFEADDDDDDEELSLQKAKCVPGEKVSEVIGEVEIMIARQDLQGKGVGTQVLCTFLWYITTHLTGIMEEFGRSLKEVGCQPKLKYLRVKIGAENARSIKLFEKVGFRKVSEVPNYFGELELRLSVTGQEYEELMEKAENAKIALYRPPTEDRLE